MHTVKQLARLAGVTSRTLRYYDQVGLLTPARVGENGYRYYGPESLLRLQQILLYRELGLPLERIRAILDQSGFDPLDALEQHRAELCVQIERLQRLAATVDGTIQHLKGKKVMTEKQLFEGFSDEQQAAYEQEAMQRWDPEIVRASNQKWKAYTAAEKERIFAEGNAVYAGFLAAIPAGPDSPQARACVEAWRRHMAYFWQPDDEQLVALAEGYVSDPRFKATFDRIDPRLAEFVRAAVRAYAGKPPRRKRDFYRLACQNPCDLTLSRPVKI